MNMLRTGIDLIEVNQSQFSDPGTEQGFRRGSANAAHAENDDMGIGQPLQSFLA